MRSWDAPPGQGRNLPPAKAEAINVGRDGRNLRSEDSSAPESAIRYRGMFGEGARRIGARQSWQAGRMVLSTCQGTKRQKQVCVGSCPWDDLL